MENKRMYKVITHIERKDGSGYWMRVGSGFVNKDNSINMYLDAVPVTPSPKGGMVLQLREMTEEELRERAEKRTTYAARGPLGAAPQYDYNGLPSAPPRAQGAASSAADADLPF